ncbi:GGDEF domain-containing protein [Halobacteriovorax sp. HLS]|uniref:GGDEF domain-containing protein n=1 Tax=Halobacteriovorax sp. HLS TaxID=2234000 RepID=UPI0013E3D2E2|nr:GGDEF domain-containing protein [Halobacteriovorax sp. HLS]
MNDELNGQHYKKLIEFIFECDQLEGLKKVYESLDQFWISEFLSSSINVFSVHKDSAEKRYCRQFWRAKSQVESLTTHDLNEIRGLIKTSPQLEQSWIEVVKSKDEYLYVFSCGESYDQFYYAGVKVSEKVQDKLLNYLVTYLNTTSLKFNKFSEADKLKSLVHVDDVTGLYNQRKFLKDIDNQISKYEEQGELFSVIFIDIDHFKSVNDGHGHLVGTQLLSDVATVLKRVVRETDLCYRYGGDEFVIVVPSCNGEDAKDVGLRILRGITREKFFVSEEKGMNGSHTFKLSVSVGVATFPKDAKTRVEIISIADKMMYKAKQSGRGQVCFAGEMFTEEG